MSPFDTTLIGALASPAAFAIILLFVLRWFAYKFLPSLQSEHKDQMERIIASHNTDSERDRTVYTDSINRLSTSLDLNSEAVKALAHACQTRREGDLLKERGGPLCPS